jgi:nucleoid DNA-binding protein
LNRKELSSRVAKRLKVKTEIVDAVIETAFDEIGLQLVLGDTVKIRGFGKFLVKVREARKSFNPVTRSIIELPARRQLMFQPGQQLRADVFPVRDRE